MSSSNHIRDDRSTRSNRSTKSDRSYHSTTSSHRSRARPRDIVVDKDVWSDENDEKHEDFSISSRRSESSIQNIIKPTNNIEVPVDINLSAEQSDHDSFFDDDDDRSTGSAGNQTAGRSKASRGIRRHRSRSRNTRQARSKQEIELSGDTLDDVTYNNVSNDTVYVNEMYIVDLHGENGFYTGELSKSTTMPNGSGRFDYEKEGRFYDGNWIHGRWTGNGTLSNGDGDLYVGVFKNNRKHGEGIMKWADGRIFEGEYIRGLMIQGKMTYPDGSVYGGSWVDGKRHGKGKFCDVDCSEYDGEFREGNYHGHGKMTLANGGWYVGEWNNGKMHGRGKEIRADGTLRHDGEWNLGQPTFSSVSNDTSYVQNKQIVDILGEKGVYTGELSRTSNMPNGKGRMEYEEEGRFYEGDWVHGRWNGHGSFSDGNGDVYEGDLKDDTKHGEGIMKFADGSIHQGKFLFGKLAQGKMIFQPGSVFTGSRVGAAEPQGNTNNKIWADGGWYIGEWSERGNKSGADDGLSHDVEWGDRRPKVQTTVDKEPITGQSSRTSQSEMVQSPGQAAAGNSPAKSQKASGSTPLPKCFCNWKHCRTYQKAFREYKHPFFNGFIKLKFRQSDFRSMTLKSAVDQTLHVESVKRNDWKEGDNGEPFCRYYVARHHFTEALINEYFQDRRKWDWTRPLSMEEAKKYLWSFDRDDIFHSEGEESGEEEDRYVQAPNVPKDKVRKMLKDFKDQRKNIMLEESVVQTEPVSKESMLAEKEKENRRLRDEIQECKHLLSSLRDMAQNFLTISNVPKDMVREMTTELEDRYNNKDFGTEPVANQQETDSAVDTEPVSKEAMLAEKEEENRRLRDEIQECKQQLTSLRDMVNKLVDIGQSSRYSKSRYREGSSPEDDDSSSEEEWYRELDQKQQWDDDRSTNSDERSTRSKRSTKSDRSYHSTTSSHRSRARSRDIEVDKDVWSDEQDTKYEDFSISSRQSESSIQNKPTNIEVPVDINLSEEESDDDSFFTDDRFIGSARNQSAGRSKASRGIRRRRSRSRSYRRHRYKDPRDGGNNDHNRKDEVNGFEVLNDNSYVKDKHIVDPNGEKGVYTGELSDSTCLPNGRGRLEYEKGGRWYEGDWVDGRLTGSGSLATGDGDFYKGGFKNDHKHGEGIMKFADGRIYEGEYIRGQMLQGKMAYPDGSFYTGSWANGMRNGKGKIVFVDGGESNGEFREGLLHGRGKTTWADGGWYVGEWSEGEKHGRGKEIRPDGSLRHAGEWARGQPLQSTAGLPGRRQQTKQNGQAVDSTQAEDDMPVNDERSGHRDKTDELHELDSTNITSNAVQDSSERAKIQSIRSLRPSADRFFSTLRAYLSCRKAMEAAFLHDEDMSTIATIEARTNSGGIEKHGEGSNQYKPEFQQQSVDGKPVRSLDDLYEAANIAVPSFRKLVNDLARKASESSEGELHTDDQHHSPLVVIATKGRDRAQEKATDDYASREPHPAVSWLYDIVRGSIQFQSAQQILRCIKLLLEGDEYYVVKAKNRFMNPTLTGYRDFAVWVQIKCEGGFLHVCEIQIHHTAMKQLDSDLGTHTLYEYFRWFFSGAIGSLTGRLQDLEMISEGYELDGFSLEIFLKHCTDEDRLEKLALLFHEQMCEFDLALTIYDKLLKLRETEYEADHIAIAKTYDTKAAVYRDMGQLDRAMELYEMCVIMYRGTSKMSLAATYQHMAIIKTETGFPEDALSLYQRSLDILSDMPAETVEMSLADIYNNMGNAKRDLGLLDDAIALHQKSLQIKKEYLGEEHSSVATSLSNLGLVRLRQGMVDEAISLFLQAMNVDQRVVGAEHASIAVTQGNLGLAYEQKGEFEAAREMYGKALAQQRSILGNQHEEVAWTIENLARVHVKERDFDRAIELLEESLEIKMSLFDADHDEVNAASNMLESARRKKSREEEYDVDNVKNSQSRLLE